MNKSSPLNIRSLFKGFIGLFMQNQTSKEQTDLESYLSYYQGLENPRYAVLVTGAWGVGKTFQVRRAIPPENHYYVSLFGMRSAEEIEAAVFSQMHPLKAEARALVDGNAKTSLLGFPVGALGSLYARYRLKQEVKSDRTIIFDDLERSSIEPKELLGAINHYVEHHSCRVVVIAHDGKLTNELIEQKEKVFGQVIRASPQINLAYPAFAKGLKREEEQKLLLKIQPVLITLFNESEIHSLRILRHVMEDSLRLMRCLTPEQRNHPEAVKELISLTAALNFECRANRITKKDLNDRMMQGVAYSTRDQRDQGGERDQKPPFVAAKDRYKSIRLDSTVLPDEILQQILFDGIYRSDNISGALNASPYFAKPKELPNWREFIEFDRQPDDVAEEARQRLNDEFQERRIIEPGDMLHMFALRLMQAENGLIPLSIAEAAGECKRYVDDLRSGSRLKPLPTAWRERESLHRSYGGIAYLVTPNYQKEWAEIFGYLNEQRQRVMAENLAVAVPNILKLVEEDGQALYSLLNHTAENSEQFAEVPVLSAIDPKEFLASWLRSHPRNWYWIENAIFERFKHGDKAKTDSEARWVEEIATLMELEAAKARGIRAVRIRRHIPRLPPADGS